MSVLHWNLWRYNVFKQAKNAVSSPKRAIECVLISETNIVSLMTLYLDIGFCLSSEYKMAWQVVTKLMLPMQGHEGLVLPISERSHIPLDPLNRLTKEEREGLTALDDLGVMSITRAKSQLAEDNRQGANARMFQTIFIIFGILAAVLILFLLWRHK